MWQRKRQISKVNKVEMELTRRSVRQLLTHTQTKSTLVDIGALHHHLALIRIRSAHEIIETYKQTDTGKTFVYLAKTTAVVGNTNCHTAVNGHRKPTRAASHIAVNKLASCCRHRNVLCHLAYIGLLAGVPQDSGTWGGATVLKNKVCRYTAV